MHYLSKKLIRQYILRPLRLILASATILVMALGLFALDQIGTFSLPRLEPTSSWLYVLLPKMIVSVLSSPIFLTVLIVVYFFKSLVLFVMTADLSQIYLRTRRSLLHTLLHEVPWSGLAWFLVSEFTIYLLFAVVIAIVYLSGGALWHRYSVDTFWVVVSSLLVLYPLFYGLASLTLFLAILPLSAWRKLTKVSLLVKSGMLLRLYVFYALRACIEIGLGLLVPILLLYLIPLHWVAAGLAAIGLVVPFTVLKGSSFEFKLMLYSSDDDVRRTFETHFAADAASQR